MGQSGLLDAETIGVIPRSVERIFQLKEVRPYLIVLILSILKSLEQEHPDFQYRIQITFLEIYREEIFDLLHLHDQQRSDIAIREDGQGKLMVSGLREVVVENVEQAMGLLQKGMLSRTTGQTNVHDHSSRSHAIFTIAVEKYGQKSTQHAIQHRKQKFAIHLVDLAGRFMLFILPLT